MGGQLTESRAVRCLVVSPDPALAAALIRASEGTAGIDIIGTVPPQRVRAGTAPRCDVLLVGDAPGLAAAAWAREAAVACPRAAVVLLVDDDGVDTYRAALAAGARAVVPLPVAASTLAAAVADAARTGGVGGSRSAVDSGAVVAVASARGGSGASAVALGLALLARGLLIDLAGSRAGVAAALGAGPRRTLADLAHAGEVLAAGIDAVSVEHPAGLRLVAGPPDPDLLTALAAGWGTALVREARTSAGLAVVDVGAAVPGPGRDAVIAADGVVVVVTPDAWSAEAARALVTAAAAWGARGPVELVVNRWSRRAELGLRAVSRHVGAPVAAVVPDDPRGMAEYRNARMDLARWRRAAPVSALAALADRVGR